MKFLGCLALCLLFACLVHSQSNTTVVDVEKYRDMKEFMRFLTADLREHDVHILSRRIDNETASSFMFAAYDGTSSANSTGYLEVSMLRQMLNMSTNLMESKRYFLELRRLFEFEDKNSNGVMDTDEVSSDIINTWGSSSDLKRSIECKNLTSSNNSASISTHDPIGVEHRDMVDCLLKVENDNLTISMHIMVPAKIMNVSLDKETSDLIVIDDSSASNSSSNSSSEIFYILPSSINVRVLVDFKSKRDSTKRLGALLVLKSLESVKIEDFSPDNFTRLSNVAAIFDDNVGFVSWNDTNLVKDKSIRILSGEIIKNDTALLDVPEGAEDIKMENWLPLHFDQVEDRLVWSMHLGVDPRVLADTSSKAATAANTKANAASSLSPVGLFSVASVIIASIVAALF